MISKPIFARNKCSDMRIREADSQRRHMPFVWQRIAEEKVEELKIIISDYQRDDLSGRL